jgi:hypothetical protein
MALSEASEIIVFGYSGLDNHLNEALSLHLRNQSKKLRIVEWSGSGTLNSRKTYWEDTMGHNCELIHLDNITSFIDW